MEEQLIKYFQGKLNSPERLLFLKNIESDRELKAKFIEYKNMKALMTIPDQKIDTVESGEAYIRFTKRIRNRKVYRITKKAITYAATIALIIVTTYWVSLERFPFQSQEADINTLYIPAGQRIRVTLQDGTNVWINSQTTLSYPIPFHHKERRVTVEGEAFFEVAKDADRPFIVSTQGVEMEVLGTSFNVCSYSSEDIITTSLIEGSLRVYFAESKSTGIILKENEQLFIHSDQMYVEAITHPDYFLWKDGIYSFKNELLVDVLKKLELYYDVKIRVEDPSIYQWEYTGKFRQRDGIDKILWMIQKIHNFKIERDEENNTITLK